MPLIAALLLAFILGGGLACLECEKRAREGRWY